MAKRNSVLSMTLAVAGICAVSALGAWAQVQNSGQQACLNGINKTGAAVAKTQGKENVACVKAAGKAGPAGAQLCLTADAKGKVAKAKGKTTAAETKSCTAPPSYGYTSAAAVNTAAQQAELDLAGDVFGPNLDTALISCSTSKASCGCQQKVAKNVEALAAVKLATFVACKKAALKAGANSVAALVACVDNAGTVGSIAADSKGKIAKALGKLNADIAKACDTPGVTGTAFPGDCTGQSGTGLGTCLDTQVECRVCRALTLMDGLTLDCDAFDNGVADASCANPPIPTPTPTATATPTETATPTPVATSTPPIFRGTLSRSNGNWFYGGNPGLPGGNALCNTTFPGTHVCTITDLQDAQALGELVGASDNVGAIVRFWKIDPAETNIRQCINDSGTVRWSYGTAHTASKGVYVNFNSIAGTLGAESLPVACPAAGNQSSVGCCLSD